MSNNKMVSKGVFKTNYESYGHRISMPTKNYCKCDKAMRILNKMSIDREPVPSIQPCFGNEKINVDAEIASSGLSAISVKHHKTTKSLGVLPSDSEVISKYSCHIAGIQPRNSFRNLHKPDLKHEACLCDMSPDELRVFFLEHAKNNAKSELFYSESDDSLSAPSIGNFLKIPCEDCITLYTSECLDKESSMSLQFSEDSLSKDLLSDSDLSPEFKLQHHEKELFIDIGV